MAWWDNLWQKQTRPVYNRIGRQIGYTLDDAQLARGQLQLLPGETPGPAAEWHVKEFGIITTAAQYLLDKGLQPTWLSATQAQTIYDAGNQILPAIKLPGFSLLADPVTGAFKPMTGLLVGGAGLAALLLIARRR